jgi:hypothetical protein
MQTENVQNVVVITGDQTNLSIRRTVRNCFAVNTRSLEWSEKPNIFARNETEEPRKTHAPTLRLRLAWQ